MHSKTAKLVLPVFILVSIASSFSHVAYAEVKSILPADGSVISTAGYADSAADAVKTAAVVVNPAANVADSAADVVNPAAGDADPVADAVGSADGSAGSAPGSVGTSAGVDKPFAGKKPLPGGEDRLVETAGVVEKSAPADMADNLDKPADRYDFPKLIKSSVIYAEVAMDSKLYKNGSRKSAAVGKIEKGSKVEVLEDTDYKWYKIRVSDRLTGWVPAEALIIPPDPPTNKTMLMADQLEKYVKIKGLTSSTNYLIWVDIDRQHTYVFQKSENAWKLLKTFICSTGRNKSPTRRGIFKIQDRGTWFYSTRYGSGAKYWMRFSGGYLLHSVAMDRKGNIIDDTLGSRASRGCVRHSVENSLWLYRNIPANTTVFID